MTGLFFVSIPDVIALPLQLCLFMFLTDETVLSDKNIIVTQVQNTIVILSVAA